MGRTSATAPRQYRLRAKILTLLATVVLFLGIAELGLRIAFPSDRLEYVADDEVLWRYRSDQVGLQWVADRSSSYRATINAEGFRGAGGNATGDGEKTVLALGDSFTFGSGVEDDETFCAQLEAVSGGQLNVINAGVGGWGVFQQEARLRRLIDKVKPDYVLVTIPDGIIVRQPFESEREKADFLRLSRIRQRIRRYSRLITVVGRTLEQFKLASTGRAVPNARPSDYSEGDGPSESYREYWAKDRERILAMKQLADRHGAQFVLVAWPYDNRNTSFFLAEMAAMAEYGITTVDLSESLGRFFDRPGLAIPNDGHPTAAAHRLAAEQIHRAIENEEN